MVLDDENMKLFFQCIADQLVADVNSGRFQKLPWIGHIISPLVYAFTYINLE